MARGGAGNMLGVGGTRSNINRKALRGGDRGARIGGTQDGFPLSARPPPALLPFCAGRLL